MDHRLVTSSHTSRLGTDSGNPLRACLEIRSWVAQATGLYRPATRRAKRGARPEPIKTRLLLCEAAAAGALPTAPRRSAGRPGSCRERVALATDFRKQS